MISITRTIGSKEVPGQLNWYLIIEYFILVKTKYILLTDKAVKMEQNRITEYDLLKSLDLHPYKRAKEHAKELKIIKIELESQLDIIKRKLETLKNYNID